MNTLIMFDVPKRRARERLEALLRMHGFVWLFPHARWSSKPLLAHERLVRRVTSRLAAETYRIVLLEITARSRKEARWLTAAPREPR